MTKLTDAQVYTLRRMSSGTRYVLRGDHKCADELRPESHGGLRHVNAPSVRVLVRLGLVEFTFGGNKELTKYYAVQLTDRGREAAATAKVKSERE